MKATTPIRDTRISEDVDEALKFWGQKPVCSLNEMAVSIKNYKKRVDSLRFQLVENWCLCMYCKLYDSEESCFSHWKNELYTCFKNLKFLSLKGSQNKASILRMMLIDDYDYNDSKMIYDIVKGKFKKENISLVYLEEPAKRFSNNIDEIIEVISDDDALIDDYIDMRFS